MEQKLMTITVELPPLPWTVEAHTAFGRVLATLNVPTDYVPNTFTRADLSCGAILMWVGEAPVFGPAPPSIGPGESIGVEGDCDP